MTNRERVINSFLHKQPDKTPYEVGFTQKAWQRFLEYVGGKENLPEFNNCLCSISVEPKNSWIETQPDMWKDQFGVVWNRSVDKDIGVVSSGALVTPENLNEFAFPDPEDPSRYESIPDVLKRNQNQRFTVVNIGFTLFERAWTLSGMEDLLSYMITDGDFVHKFLDKIADFNVRLIENACKYDIDAVMLGDDWGQQTSLIMGPALWREFIKPRIKKMYSAIKCNGKFVMIHSCGKVDSIFGDLVECGLDSFNPFQPEVMDVYKIKEEYGNDLSFHGGISTQITLPYGSVQDIKDETKRLIEKIGKNGGYIAAPAHSIPGDAKPENILAMMEVLNNQ